MSNDNRGLGGSFFPRSSKLVKDSATTVLNKAYAPSRELMSDVTARPHPDLPGPKSRTRHGWLVQGTVWDYGMRPRLPLQVSDLGPP